MERDEMGHGRFQIFYSYRALLKNISFNHQQKIFYPLNSLQVQNQEYFASVLEAKNRMTLFVQPWSISQCLAKSPTNTRNLSLCQ